jgi:hypothetical protein
MSKERVYKICISLVADSKGLFWTSKWLPEKEKAGASSGRRKSQGKLSGVFGDVAAADKTLPPRILCAITGFGAINWVLRMLKEKRAQAAFAGPES